MERMGRVKRLCRLLSLSFFLAGIYGCSEKNEAVDPGGRDFFEKGNCQTYWMQGNEMSVVQAGEAGYYFLERGILYYFDISSGQVMPLCNKPECRHKEEGCNARMGSSNLGWIGMGEDGLYTIEMENDGISLQENLYRIDLTGGGRAFVLTLREAGLPEQGIISSTFGSGCTDDGVLYFTSSEWKDDGNRNMSLWKVKTESGDKPEKIYAGDENADRSAVYYLSVFEERVCFYYYEVQKEGGKEEMKAGVYCYSQETGETKEILSEAAESFYILEDVLYYTLPDQPGIFTCSLLNGRKEELSDTGIGAGYRIYWDGKHMIGYPAEDLLKQWSEKGFMGPEIEILVMDRNGREESRIIYQAEKGDMVSLLGGAEDYLFLNSQSGIKAMLKSQGGTEKNEWKELTAE